MMHMDNFLELKIYHDFFCLKKQTWKMKVENESKPAMKLWKLKKIYTR